VKVFFIQNGKIKNQHLKKYKTVLNSICLSLMVATTIISCKEVSKEEVPVEVLDNHTLNRKANAILIDSLVRQVYVPIYSDIYNQTRDTRTLLTATLSIRNTSLQDSLFVSKIDYYNTEGDLVRSYIDSPIYLTPMESIDYVIEQQDTSGGSGANFLIDWYSKKQLNPLFQAVMVGGLGSQAFSFTTEGIEITEE
jgi:hypothetical protein